MKCWVHVHCRSSPCKLFSCLQCDLDVLNVYICLFHCSTSVWFKYSSLCDDFFMLLFQLVAVLNCKQRVLCYFLCTFIVTSTILISDNPTAVDFWPISFWQNLSWDIVIYSVAWRCRGLQRVWLVGQQWLWLVSSVVTAVESCWWSHDTVMLYVLRDPHPTAIV